MSGEDEGWHAYLRRLWATAGVVVLVVVAFLAVWEAPLVFMLAFAGVVVATFLRTLADWVRDRTGLGDGAALAAVVVALAMLVGLLGWLIAPRLAEQAGELREQLPRAVEKVREQLQKTSWGRELIARAPGAGDVSAQGLDVFARATGYITGAFGVLAHGFVVLLLGLFLAIDPGHYRDGAIKLLPFRARPRAREVLDETGRTLKGWLVCQAISMAIIGVGTTAGLLVLRMPLALILGLLTTFLSFIPNLGIVIAMVPVTLLALVQGPTTALWVIGIYLAVQAFDANVVMPFVIQRTMLIPPALVIFAELLMGSLAGLLGVLLATPMLAVIMAVVKLLYVRDTLDDEVEMPGDDERPGKGAG